MSEKTERQRMLAGELYLATDSELVAMRKQARRLCRLYNQTTEDETERRLQILRELFGKIGPRAEIEPPLYCDYGCHIQAGAGLFMNFNCVILDCNLVTLGDNVLIGPAVQMYGGYHPTDPKVRATGRELAAPIRIGNNVWIGGGAIISAGVTVGDNTTIGAGSVVVKDIPANAVAVGNPCRVIRQLSDISS
jgi:maltose O-acetyltransferase